MTDEPSRVSPPRATPTGSLGRAGREGCRPDRGASLGRRFARRTWLGSGSGLSIFMPSFRYVYTFVLYYWPERIQARRTISSLNNIQLNMRGGWHGVCFLCCRRDVVAALHRDNVRVALKGNYQYPTAVSQYGEDNISSQSNMRVCPVSHHGPAGVLIARRAGLQSLSHQYNMSTKRGPSSRAPYNKMVECAVALPLLMQHDRCWAPLRAVMGKLGIGAISNVYFVGQHWLRDGKGIVKQHTQRSSSSSGVLPPPASLPNRSSQVDARRPRCHPKTSPERIINQTIRRNHLAGAARSTGVRTDAVSR
ncbi:hypothetical protein F5144DRAFT_116914 [Chaetomium tenue]|uniref:Uncharacterized protein n=1 Tax=Chaetomium tenue TaxID=1854479 RepID=A0ACB7PIP3_9PEZI|nr:hypothetical protein F5144DRAFT_116914 [Chaetomium globosum]